MKNLCKRSLVPYFLKIHIKKKHHMNNGISSSDLKWTRSIIIIIHTCHLNFPYFFLSKYYPKIYLEWSFRISKSLIFSGTCFVYIAFVCTSVVCTISSQSSFLPCLFFVILSSFLVFVFLKLVINTVLK